MIKKIKAAIINNKLLVANFGYLSALQLVAMLIPLATYPYLIDVLGTELWGKVIFAQVVVSYFTIVINFGLNVTSTKTISFNRDNKQKLSQIVSSVLSIKTGVFFLSFLVLILLINNIPSFEEEKYLYLFSFCLCISEWIFPIWYFQGIEKMKYITFINLISKLTFFFLIFIVIKERSDYLLVPLLNGVGAFIGGVVSLWIVFAKHKIRFVWPSIAQVKRDIKESITVFASDVIISVKDRFNTILIGVFLGSVDVVIYDLGIKLMNLFTTFITIVNRTIYPKMSLYKDVNFFNKVIRLLFIVTLFGVAVFQLFLEDIILFLGDQSVLSGIDAIRILTLTPLLMCFSLPLSLNRIIVAGKYKALIFGMILTTLFYLMLIGIAYNLSILNSVLAFCIITFLVYGFELVYRYVYVQRSKL